MNKKNLLFAKHVLIDSSVHSTAEIKLQFPFNKHSFVKFVWLMYSHCVLDNTFKMYNKSKKYAYKQTFWFFLVRNILHKLL